MQNAVFSQFTSAIKGKIFLIFSDMKVSVIGGGISGLTAAFYCSKLPQVTSIKVYESSHRLGGWVQSTVKNDFIFEHGPRTIRPAGPQGKKNILKNQHTGTNPTFYPKFP